MWIAPNGNMYIADTSHHRIRKVTKSTNVITTVCGTGTASSTGDGGQATSATINNPYSVTGDSSENLYVIEGGGNRVRSINAGTGVIQTVISGLSLAYNITYYNSCLYFGNTNSTILKLVNTGTLFSTYTSTSQSGYNTPIGICFDSSGNMYVCNYSSNNILKSAGGHGGTQTTLISSGQSSPISIACKANDDLYITQQGSHCTKQYTLASSYTSGTVVVGQSGTPSYTDNVVPTSGAMNGPWGSCFGPDGFLYICDANNNRIRRAIRV